MIHATCLYCDYKWNPTAKYITHLCMKCGSRNPTIKDYRATGPKVDYYAQEYVNSRPRINYYEGAPDFETPLVKDGFYEQYNSIIDY